MKFKKKKYLVGITIGAMLLIINIVTLLKTSWFLPVAIIALTIGWGQIWLDFFLENQKQRDIETRFLDFVRNLTGAIKSGMPVSRAIVHISKVDYGALSPYVRKLGHQAEWSIPVRKSLLFFSNATKNDVIKRSIATVIEAEQSGGNMEDVLESITTSLVEIKKIKEQRRASIHSQVLQSYIIFFIFIGVMIVIQNMLLPYLLGSGEQQGVFGSLSGSGFSTITGTTQTTATSSMVMEVNIQFDSFTGFVITFSKWFSSIRGVFLMLTLIQGFFAGVIVGKLSEGDMAAGLKHSLVLMTVAFFVMSLFGGG